MRPARSRALPKRPLAHRPMQPAERHMPGIPFAPTYLYLCLVYQLDRPQIGRTRLPYHELRDLLSLAEGLLHGVRYRA